MPSLKEMLGHVFSIEGPLAKSLGDYEERTEQREMAEQILSAYSSDEITLIEAGTGIGKSLAYLIPAILWALKTKEKTVVSTHTIALQEQLIHKDIPFLLKALGAEMRAVLVKGMNNYLCLRKLEEAREWGATSPQIEQWAEKTKEGSRSEISFPLNVANWQEVAADSDSCTNVQCAHYERCFFFKARKAASDAQLLIVNHHLLLADLLSEQSNGILPFYERLVVDEAHHLEQVALTSLSIRLDGASLERLLDRLLADGKPEKSRLTQLKDALVKIHKGKPTSSLTSILSRLEIDLPSAKRGISLQIQETFNCVAMLDLRGALQYKKRLRSDFFEQEMVTTEIRPLFQGLASSLAGYAVSLSSLAKDVLALQEAEKSDKVKGCVAEIEAIGAQLEKKAISLESFFSPDPALDRVRWIEDGPVVFHDARLDVSAYLHEHLFKSLSTVTLCSATLATNQDFQFVKQQLGIKERTVTEKIYGSPFDYLYRTLLLVPTDIPFPSDPSFTMTASEHIFRAIQASRGNAFVLFTSYEMMQACYAHVETLSVSQKKKFTFFKQGEMSRQALIRRFKEQDGSVLFGTDSFWEGVDISGEALRNVIIVKLPFKVPNDPLMEACAELLVAGGKDPFHHHSLPHAIVKFKQGFGRLMRKKSDRGCILCLDKRLITKPYGQTFLTSLPSCQTVFDTSDRVFEEMKRFYQKTIS